jgi:hypothetical protein
VTKEIVDQLKKLNQNIERFLRMIDIKPERNFLKRVEGIVELDPNKKYIFFIDPTITEKEFYDLNLGTELVKFTEGFPIMIIGGDFIRDFQVKE